MAEDYTVAAQGQGYAVGPSGRLVDVWRATVVTNPEGYSINVDIPLAVWRADPAGSVDNYAAPLVAAAKASGAV